MESKAMVSRSLRLHQSTLNVLKKQAEARGIGITVYIREILEAHVEVENLLTSLAIMENDVL